MLQVVQPNGQQLAGLGHRSEQVDLVQTPIGLTLRQHRLDPWLVFSPMGNEVHHGLVCRQRIGSGRLQLSLAQDTMRSP